MFVNRLIHYDYNIVINRKQCSKAYSGKYSGFIDILSRNLKPLLQNQTVVKTVKFTLCSRIIILRLR